MKKAKYWKGFSQILTHGLELANQLLLGPLGPFLLVCIDGTQDRSTWFPTVLDGWNIQIVDEHNIRVLLGKQKSAGKVKRDYSMDSLLHVFLRIQQQRLVVARRSYGLDGISLMWKLQAELCKY